MIDCGEEGVIAIGLTQANPVTRSGQFPGWPDNTLGIGYHGDNGGIYHNSGRPIELTEFYTTGDIVGCYICRARISDKDISLVQFTKNGVKLLFPRVLENAEWYPTVGIGSPGAIVDTNFGGRQFSYNPKGMIGLGS